MTDSRPRRFGEKRTMYDWVGPRPSWYDGPLRSEGDPEPPLEGHIWVSSGRPRSAQHITWCIRCGQRRTVVTGDDKCMAVSDK